ncbi:MAG: Gfo/Idh/MocA family oxidoreductase [Candidatus Omnitrophota bacterium]|nr:Gfo/Idh/MocA family oxidoreductase [Candidatus Omnitrophota bacterium]
MKTGFLITARLKSTRLPEKLLRDICGRPILAHMLDRVKLARRVDQVVICTSTNAQDDRLEDLAAREGVACFRGDADDVVKRLYDASVTFGLDYIVSITADCPFADPAYADRIVETFQTTKADLIRALDLPHGVYTYGVKPVAFERVLEIKDSRDSEVWGGYFTDTDLFSVYDLPIENPLHRQPSLRMTLDYPEDLEFFQAVFAALYRPGKVFSLDEILQFLRDHPEVVEVNRRCAVQYQKRWAVQSSVNLTSRYPVRRVAVVGCGSIGQRHIRNLRRLGITDLVALRSRKGHVQDMDPQHGVREVDDWSALLETKPDAAIISNPTSLHLEVAERFLPHVRGLLIEKPLAHSLDGVQAFLERVRAHKVVTFVGYNLPFQAAIRAVQDLLQTDRFGRRLLFQCQAGQWLPDWHPAEDYRQAYYARKDLGGGVALTLSHEVQLALQLLGPARSVLGVFPPSDELPLEVDVIADLMIQHLSGGVSQIHLDYLQRPAHRTGVVSCERGWIAYDLMEPKVVAQRAGEAAPHVAWERAGYDANDAYLDELRTFLRYVSEGRIRHAFDAHGAAQSLAIVGAAFASARSGRLEAVADVGRDRHRVTTRSVARDLAPV